ncbi:hypothetical protein V1514DRAFT_332655 [Lipomyces japonicus]|uniref:uncharacterized protein n=1 Tax=Lipomyces japonicus TaxID=56871 RepID=UPI0034CF5DD8
MVFWNSNKFEVEDKLVVISGASQGLGLALAKDVFKRGANLVLVARRVQLLQDAVKQIEKLRVSPNQTVIFINADLSISTEAERVVNSLPQPPDVLLCCAGSSIPKLFVDLTTDELRSGIDVNYCTALYLAHAGLKAMTKVEVPNYTRHIVFFSSVVGFYSFIGYGQYAPLKSALRSLGDVLRQESIPYDIKVPVVFAGNFLSEGYEIENKFKPEITKKIEGPSQAITAEECSARVLSRLDAGDELIVTDFIGTVLSSTMLGGAYRSIVQVFFAILLAIFAPVVEWTQRRDIKSFYASKRINTAASSESEIPGNKSTKNE